MKQPSTRTAVLSSLILALNSTTNATANDDDNVSKRHYEFIAKNNSRKRTLLRGTTNNNDSIQHDYSSEYNKNFINNIIIHPHQQLQKQRKLQTTVTSNYRTQNPWYPSHDLLTCLSDYNPPYWMTWQGGYAEAHLFPTKKDCCKRWFPELSTCLEEEVDASVEEMVGQTEEENVITNIDEGGNEEEGMQQMTNEGQQQQQPSLNTNRPVMEDSTNQDSEPLIMTNRPLINNNEVDNTNNSNEEGEEQEQLTLSDLGLSIVNERPPVPMSTQAVSTESIGEENDGIEPMLNDEILITDDLTIIRADKVEIVGIPVTSPPTSPTPPISAPIPSSTSTNTNNNVESPYTISTSTFGPLSVAADTCSNGCPPNSSCVGNSASGQLIQDTECSPCATGQTWWPCDIDGLCWCHLNDTPRIAPAPKSGIDILVKDTYYTICDDILSQSKFNEIAPNSQYPYTYTGLCDAILSYNAQHSEKIFGHGNTYQRTAELAAFIGNTLHESDEYRASREYLMCADHIVVGDPKYGDVYCKPCDPGSFDWSTKKCTHSLVSGNSDFNEYCQPSSKPPEACNCGSGSGESGELEGYVNAKYLYFGRGAIQLSWNYNYIGASVALTGSANTFCDNPDVVATEGKYAWGAGIYFWMEHVKEGTTSHMETLINGGDFGKFVGSVLCVILYSF